MRKLWIVLGVVVVVLVGAAVLAANRLGDWVNDNRDAVAAQASETLGREIGFGEVGISFWGGLAVQVADVRVGDDPAFSKEDFVTADAVDVHVKLLPALFGNIEVANVVLQSPSIHVIQTDEGLSTDSLAGGAAAEGDEEAAAPPALLVAMLDIRDGTLRFTDRTAKPPVELGIEQLDFTASDISFTDPVEFELTAALFGAGSRNAEVSGTVGPLDSDSPRADLKVRLAPLPVADARRLAPIAEALPEDLAADGSFAVSVDVDGTLEDLRFDVKIDGRDAAVRLGESFDKAKGKAFELALAGRKQGDQVDLPTANVVVDRTRLSGRATVTDLENPKFDFAMSSDEISLAAVGAAEPGSPDALRKLEVTGKGTLPDSGPNMTAAVRSPDGTLGGAPYRDLAIDLRMANQKVDIQKLSLAAYDGTVAATGSYDMRGKVPRMAFDTDVAGMRVEKILESELMTGELGAKLGVRGAGEGAELQRSMTGGGRVAIRNGVLRQFNPAGETMRALLGLGILGSGLGGFVNRHPKVFGVGDTPFDELSGNIDIRDGWVHMEGFELDATDYVVRGSGRYSFEGQADFKTQLVLSPALSDEILVAEPKLRYLRASDGRVELPVVFRGTPPKIAALPDVSRIAQGAARAAATDLLVQALGVERAEEGAAGSSAGAASESAGAADESAPQEAAPPPTAEDLGDQLLRRGLGELLGGGKKEQ